MGFLSKQRQELRANAGGQPEKSSPLFGGSDDLWEVMCGYSGDNNKWMEGCSLLLYAEHRDLKMMLKDKNTGKLAFAVLNPALPLTDAIVEVLECGGLDWRNPRGK